MSPRVTRVADLVACQRSRALRQAMDVVVTQSGSVAPDFSLRDQTRHAAVSILSSLADGCERSRLAEFHQPRPVARRSRAALRARLYLALDDGHVSQGPFSPVLAQAEDAGRRIGEGRPPLEKRRHPR